MSSYFLMKREYFTFRSCRIGRWERVSQQGSKERYRSTAHIALHLHEIWGIAVNDLYHFRKHLWLLLSDRFISGFLGAPSARRHLHHQVSVLILAYDSEIEYAPN